MTLQNPNDAGSHAQNTPKSTSIDTNTITSATNTQVSNPTVPLVLSFLACLVFALIIIALGYIKGNMHIEAVYYSLTNFT